MSWENSYILLLHTGDHNVCVDDYRKHNVDPLYLVGSKLDATFTNLRNNVEK